MFEEVKNRVKGVKNVLVIAHKRPDADTLGSAIAVKDWLNSLGKNVTMACVDKPSPVFGFLPNVGQFVREFDLKSFELIFILDAGASYMTDFHKKYPDLFAGSIPIVNIDHHASNDNFGALNIVDAEAPSVTVMIYRMFQEFGFEINKEVATALLAGVYGDTGSFMHSNTTAEVYDIASDLVEKGADIKAIISNLFKRTAPSTLKLWGQVLEKAYVTDDNVVMSVVQDEDFQTVGANPDQLSGVIDYLNMVPGSKYAVLINEDRKGNVKGSFRTRNEGVDVSRIAAVFGGGGHPKASGFMLPGKLESKVKYEIVGEGEVKKALDF